MRKYFLIFFVFIVSFSQARADSLPAFEKKLNLEREMKQQIENDLNLLVDKKWYQVNAIINLTKSRELRSQEVSGSNSQEKNSEKSLSKPEISTDEVLPGFDPPPAPISEENPGREKPIVNQSQQSALYESVDQIKSLTINLILNENIPSDQEALIQKYLDMRWVGPNNGLVSVSTLKKEFPQPEKDKVPLPPPPPTAWEKVQGFVETHAPLLLIGFFLIIITLILILVSNRSAKTDISIENKNIKDESFSQNSPDPKTLEALLQELFTQPLLGRSYLQSLKREDQRKILDLFRTSSLLPLLKQWLLIPAHVSLPEMDVNDLIPQKTLAELKAFKKIRLSQQEAPFGYLLDLNSQELFQMLEDESLATMAPILSYLPPHHLQGILSHLNQSDQEELIKQVQHYVFSTPVVTAIDQRLRQRFEEQSHLLMNPKQSSQDVIQNMLEQSPHGSEIAKKLIASNPTLQNTYSRYTIEVSDLFSWEADKIKKVLGILSNETLASILQPTSIQEVEKRIQILSHLSKERSKIIEGLVKSRAATSSPEMILSARRELVKTMRSQMSEKVSENSGSLL